VEAELKTIPLTQGYVATVSNKDYKRVSQFNWAASVDPNTVYARRTVRDGNKRSTQYLHVFIMGVSGVDHKDHNGLHNYRGNLRVASTRQNARNLRLSSRNTSGYKGIVHHGPTGLWQVRIRIVGRRLSLGYFIDKRKAALAYDKAARRLFGKFAMTNAKLGLL